MKFIILHTFYRMKELSRQPAYLVTSLIFPAMFFWFFGVPNAKIPAAAQLLMASFSSFAILGVVLFQLANNFANEKASPWSIYLRSLPIKPHHVLISRIFTKIFFSFFAVVSVIVTAYMTVEVALPRERWAPFLIALFLGGVPFASLGLLLGVIFNPRTVVPAANLIYLPLSFAGGLWVPPNALPKFIQDISEYLPTRMYGELVWAAILNKEYKSWNIYGLIFYLIVFLLLSIFFYQKYEGEKFG